MKNSGSEPCVWMNALARDVIDHQLKLVLAGISPNWVQTRLRQAGVMGCDLPVSTDSDKDHQRTVSNAHLTSSRRFMLKSEISAYNNAVAMRGNLIGQ